MRIRSIAVMILAGATVVAFGQEVKIESTPPKSAIKINVNGSQIETPLTNAVMRDGRVLVPLRGILQEFDAEIDWMPQQKVVIARRMGVTLTLGIGQMYGIVDNRMLPLDVPAMIVNGRTLVPLRYVAEALNAYVMWDEANRTVVITSRLERKRDGGG